MTLGHKIAFSFFVVLAMLFAFALCGYVNNRWEDVEPFSLASAQSRLEVCMDDQAREEIKGLMLEAIEQALKEHIKHAFEVWMRDPTGQPDRAKVAVQRGVRAYIDSRKGVSEWTPPLCAG